MSLHVDALVVGSGPGGSVTARALAEAGLDVLIVEEGDWVEPGAVEPYSAEQMRKQYRNGGLTVALGRPPIAYTEGCGAGGGSEVNSGLYHRPPDRLLADWSAGFGIDALTPAVLEPYHRIVERELQITTAPEAKVLTASNLLRVGASALGWQGSEVPRWVRYDNLGGIVTAERLTMSRSYLPAAQKAGAKLWTQSRVNRLTTGGDRVSSAEVVRRIGARTMVLTVVADAVFVCGGAIQTPALLQRSGCRRNIGPNLSVRATVKVVAEFDREINTLSDVPTYQVMEFAPWLALGGSASRPALIALALAENWVGFGHAMERWRRLAVFYAAIQTEGRGRVRVMPGFADPLVTYRLTRGDGERMRSGLARLVHLMLAAGAVAVYPSFPQAPVVRDRRDAAEAIRRFSPSRASVMTVHLTGTAPIGEDTRRAALDSFGKMHFMQDLWVNDASMLPWAPGVNPQGTLMAVAHRNVDAFLRSHGVTPVGATP
jgi:choline dehydrogenase-like flavoprotein